MKLIRLACMLFCGAFLTMHSVDTIGTKNQTAQTPGKRAHILHYKIVQGAEIIPFYQRLWNLCALMYREYPYLYDATDTDYTYYLESYACSPSSRIILAFDGPELVGAITGIKMADYTAEHYKKPLREQGYNLEELYYLGDILLLPEYRDEGYEKMMYEQLEKNIRQDSRYTHLAYLELGDSNCNHIRTDYDKLRDAFLRQLGFERHPELSFITYYEIIGEREESPHAMVYWLKTFHD